ncbi:hypothetical protein SLINC_2804 [Streptomyces lincolnensis]|uniref:Uncharacterized protein n=1 Tax=Streptomyces lincolnensis TaxID=1915 RepID=A0A1B1M8R9_STRLN|nr:hypothetical protein [Streptomyces lincolnensis]ANS65028.1 hypothetical protein SLINC_2804 [Streptomyces lincolnensis]AXG56764.1 hypothetical protein SLCG_5609 [Streptomyces lincolnensis]QMV06819.1 hypothetical protein GJU35_14770 [Streptomyces lincolnensis]
MPGTVTRIGVTGHRSIPTSILPAVRSGMRRQLGGERGLEALSSLAAGADQLFANIALDKGIPVTAVIPGMDYEAHLGGDEAQSAYRRLLKACAHRVDLPVEPTHERAYLAAGRWIVDHADQLVAVWDGHPARGVGGTGDVVAYARSTGVPVTVLWEPGVRRDP